MKKIADFEWDDEISNAKLYLDWWIASLICFVFGHELYPDGERLKCSRLNCNFTVYFERKLATQGEWDAQIKRLKRRVQFPY